MAKRKGKPYKQKMIEALKELPNPIYDKRHGLFIYFADDKARSNQSRFDHIVDPRHGLVPLDIKIIPKGIKTCILKKDKERLETYNIYLVRNRNTGEYIKISLKIEDNNPHIAIVKTVFITKNVK